jgi:hypothetical protein
MFLLLATCARLIYEADYSEPLTKGQVRIAIIERFEGLQDIRRIIFRKGGFAGDIGFFFAECNSSDYVIVTGDARLPPMFLHGKIEPSRRVLRKGGISDDVLTFIDHFDHLIEQKESHGEAKGFNRYYFYTNSLDPSYPRIDKTWYLQFETFFNRIARRKNPNQIFWERYGKELSIFYNRTNL